MRTRLLTFAAVIALAVPMVGTTVRAADDRDHTPEAQNFALQFTAADGSVASGAPIGHFDNLRIDALVKWDGPAATGGLLVYNGNGCCNGWGILVHGTNDGLALAGKLAILAGGITIVDSDLTLPVGQWQHVRVESNGQLISMSFPSDGRTGPVFSFGIVPRNSLNVGAPSTLVIGQSFNGVIDNVEFTSLDAPHQTLELFKFNEGTGVMTTGVNGEVLDLTNTQWVRLRADEHHDE